MIIGLPIDGKPVLIYENISKEKCYRLVVILPNKKNKITHNKSLIAFLNGLDDNSPNINRGRVISGGLQENGELKGCGQRFGTMFAYKIFGAKPIWTTLRSLERSKILLLHDLSSSKPEHRLPPSYSTGVRKRGHINTLKTHFLNVVFISLITNLKPFSLLRVTRPNQNHYFSKAATWSQWSRSRSRSQSYLPFAVRHHTAEKHSRKLAAAETGSCFRKRKHVQKAIKRVSSYLRQRNSLLMLFFKPVLHFFDVLLVSIFY